MKGVLGREWAVRSSGHRLPAAWSGLFITRAPNKLNIVASAITVPTRRRLTIVLRGILLTA